jgi:septal ring factor EnvC (AmiA/AmiB activator)
MNVCVVYNDCTEESGASYPEVKFAKAVNEDFGRSAEVDGHRWMKQLIVTIVILVISCVYVIVKLILTRRQMRRIEREIEELNRGNEAFERETEALQREAEAEERENERLRDRIGALGGVPQIKPIN